MGAKHERIFERRQDPCFRQIERDRLESAGGAVTRQPNSCNSAAESPVLSARSVSSRLFRFPLLTAFFFPLSEIEKKIAAVLLRDSNPHRSVTVSGAHAL